MQKEIISFLKEADTHLSGEDISRKLKISRAAIWKNIEELRKTGYDIAATPHLGYKLISAPDKLLPQEIQDQLKTEFIGREIVYFDSTDSTMNEAFKLGIAGADEGAVVIAEGQSKGKGRMGRSWNSPKGKGIYLSILLRPEISPGDAAQITLLSVLPKYATSLKAEAKQAFSRTELTQSVLRDFERWYGKWQIKGFKDVIRQWKNNSTTIGRRVRIIDQGGTLEGKAVDLDEFGGLVIEDTKGKRIKRMTGDVVILN